MRTSIVRVDPYGTSEIRRSDTNGCTNRELHLVGSSSRASDHSAGALNELGALLTTDWSEVHLVATTSGQAT